MSRYAAFVLFLFLGFEIYLSQGIEVKVNDKDDKLCLYANLMVNFSVEYETKDNKNVTAEFTIPDAFTSSGSSCDTKTSTLKINFGDGHSWSVNFSLSNKTYQADSITFSYNLSDSTIFHDPLSNDTVTVNTQPHISDVVMDTCYSCKSKEIFTTDAVSQTLWNVLIQAFVVNGSKSENITSCSADIPVTPTTVAPTTVTPTTHTTAAPVTNVTTLPPTTPTPTPPPAIPPTGRYSIKPDENSTEACLLADFGLRIGLKQGEKYEEMNLDTNGTKVSGFCGVNNSELVLEFATVTMVFSFINESQRFRLHALNVTGKMSSGVAFSEVNTNLSLWETALGSSYMCNKKQNDTITNQLSLFTFDLRVQPFGVKKGVFSTAVDCPADDEENFIIPIAVGAALFVLILIVLLAYFIGRKRNMATGYESF
ncbi:lysosome-associated membrane glycoprotein 2 isoform X1 [Sphaeramia orbicularis]|uniref:lysosome-associated membrane glycoprotein 2 isoform X1 n=1 Tax=Sphaeramia orbicularis TaxID=375764 RepID=UPI00117C22C2|nr:lysosome-associated membrane glycoprotein 2 isoform X1 [Sphaeramia orbicularis]